jgi:chromosome segregation ATPase
MCRVFRSDVELGGVAATSANSDVVPSLSYLLADVPKRLIGGFDRKATQQLVAKLDESYRDVVLQREHLLADLQKLRTLSEQLERREKKMVAEVESLKGDLASSTQEQKSLTDQLECARVKWDSELARARADLERELEQARNELDGYKRREILLAEVASGARRRAQAIAGEARAEAELMLRKARKREAELTRDAERELHRLEAERQRLLTLAADFRHDMAARLEATLEQLTREDAESAPSEEKPALGEGDPVERGDDATT